MPGLSSRKYCRNVNKRRIFQLPMVLLLSVALTSCTLFPREEEFPDPPIFKPAKVTYETMTVKKGTIEKQVRVTGNVAATKQKNLSFTERDGVLAEIHAKQNDVVKKGDILAKLQTDDLDDQIKQYEISLRKAELYYDRACSDPDGTEMEIQNRKLDVQAAELTLDFARKQLEEATLVSPLPGIIVFREDVDVGSYVAANQTLFTVADGSDYVIEYTGEQSTKFKPGQPVELLYKNREFKGKVITAGKNIPAGGRDMSDSVWFLAEDAAKLKIGDRVDVTLTLDRRKDVVVIPRQLINRYNGRSYVDVLENDIKYEKDIETGMETATEAEVVKGLKPGDKIIRR